MLKKIEIKPLIISLILIIYQSILYALNSNFAEEAVLIGNKIDSYISFNVNFIIPYAFWYLMLFLVPYYFYKRDKKIFSNYVLSYFFVTLIANLIFFIYPTTVLRPDVIGNSIIEKIAKFIFSIDTPIRNCFPSLHCAISMLWLLNIVILKKSNKFVDTFYIIMSLLIMASTLIVKQHVFIDFISGISISLVVFLFFYKYECFSTKFIKKIKL